MNIFKKQVFIIYLVLLSTLSFSQVSIKKLEPDKRYLSRDWEVYYTKIPVSGEVRMGAMAFESNDKVKPTSFFVKIPKHTQPMLCVEISSRDGTYQARLPYTIAGLEPDVYELVLPTQYPNKLKNYTIKDITILAKVAKTCDEDAECYVLSAWNTPTFNNRQAYIYLNSEQHTELILTDSSDNLTKTIVECEKIPETITTAYNCRCKILSYDLDKFSNIQIKRIIGTIKQSFSYLDFPFRF